MGSGDWGMAAFCCDYRKLSKIIINYYNHPLAFKKSLPEGWEARLIKVERGRVRAWFLDRRCVLPLGQYTVSHHGQSRRWHFAGT